jgi:hypothetical protein
VWYIKIDKYSVQQGFKWSPSDSNLYVKRFGNEIILLVVYVGDIIMTSSEEDAITWIKSNMGRAFDMKYLGLLHYFLGVEVWQTGSNIFISQAKYARSVLDKFSMEDCKISSTPMEKGIKISTKTYSKAVSESLYRQLVGSLIYLKATRPNLSFAVSFISRFMTASKVEHWIAMR